MPVALDTNVLVYATGLDDVERQQRCADLIDRIKPSNIVLPMQVLAEFHRVLIKKGLVRSQVLEEIRSWSETYRTIDTDYAAFEGSLELVHGHGLQVFDAIILASSALAGCTMLFSEDGHHGFTWHGCTIVNPFRESIQSLLQRIQV